MTRYIIKRLLLVIPIVLGVTVIVFCIINAIPGDPGRRMLGPMASQEQVDLLNEQLGYTLPFFQRLWDYLVDVVTFNFGTSYQDGTLVMHKIMLNFPYTLKLAVLQTLGYSVIGIGLGVFSAVKQYSIGDNIIRVISIALAAFPGFWVYMIAMLVFSLYLGWLPPSGVDGWTSYIMPVGCAAILSASSLQRLTRTTMLEAIRQDYVRTARAKGCSNETVIWRHAFMNAMLPILNQIGINFGYLLGGTVIAESIFGMPGLGTVIINAVNAKDVPVVMACTIFLAAIFSVLVVLLDLLSALADPRVKAKLVK
ncbi:MAG TPA: ABC transporter permease [Candidatus Scatomorpha pullicola]|nr:ABC transporter permease [Candidatus Scatomorpha pullicola]